LKSVKLTAHCFYTHIQAVSGVDWPPSSFPPPLAKIPPLIPCLTVKYFLNFSTRLFSMRLHLRASVRTSKIGFRSLLPYPNPLFSCSGMLPRLAPFFGRLTLQLRLLCFSSLLARPLLFSRPTSVPFTILGQERLDEARRFMAQVTPVTSSSIRPPTTFLLSEPPPWSCPFSHLTLYLLCATRACASMALPRLFHPLSSFRLHYFFRIAVLPAPLQGSSERCHPFMNVSASHRTLPMIFLNL